MISEQLEQYRQKLFTIAKKFDDNPGYRLSKEERRLVAMLIPEIGLNIDLSQQSAVLKALGIVELFTQTQVRLALDSGQSIDEVYDIAIHELANSYADLAVERLELNEDQNLLHPTNPLVK